MRILGFVLVATLNGPQGPRTRLTARTRRQYASATTPGGHLKAFHPSQVTHPGHTGLRARIALVGNGYLTFQVISLHRFSMVPSRHRKSASLADVRGEQERVCERAEIPDQERWRRWGTRAGAR